MRFLKRALGTGLCCLCLVLLSGCDSEGQAPLRIGTNPWLGYEPLYLARDLGYLDGSCVQLVEYLSNTQSSRAYADGVIDAVALTLDEVIHLQSRSGDLRIMLLMDYSNGADVLIARRPIDSLRELKGHRIGVENTALGAYMLSRALGHAGLKPTDVTIVPMELHEHAAAFEQGKVDAVVTFDPARGVLLKQGGKVLFSSAQMPGEIVDVLAVRASGDARQHACLMTLRDAWYKALDYLRTHPQEALERMDQRQRIGTGPISETLSLITFPEQASQKTQLTGANPVLLGSARQMADQMARHGLLTGQVDVQTLFDRPMLERLYP